ncbi:MAG: hypothetical protein CMJ81_06215 [Planctomycetaceae bacterium]|nr:hypothetical protein [Planctomycetaceae bacterium]MBP60522.1 hypothetical protein [Planctomycetaceae bacterium]
MHEEPQLKLSASAATALVILSFITLTVWEDSACAAAVELSPQHLDAVNRRRRVVVNFDAIHGDRNFTNIHPDELVKLSLTFADDAGSHIDSIWWNWGEGHQAPYPSKLLPLYDHPGYRKWVADGIDIVRVFVDATRARGLEVFYTFRVNGSDNDLGPVRPIPMKLKHPAWLLAAPWAPDRKVYWNFSIDQVRQRKLSVLRELAENYDLDGLEIDFARSPITLPLGQQWKNRQHLTTFMRSVRLMTMEVARQRGRPMLLAARVPENIAGCRIDGIDIETWARDQLLDIIVLGCRSFEGDVADFRQVTSGTPIKILGGSDEHHTSDGYDWPPIDVLRGVFANWWQQGVDGIYCFNWTYATPEDAGRVGALLHDSRMAPVHRTLYREIGEVQSLRHKDKTFVVQRRGGGGSGAPGTVGWETPRFFQNTNMFAQLPAHLDNAGRADTHVKLLVGDDLVAEASHIKDITLRIILHDAVAGEPVEILNSSAKPAPPDEGRIERALISLFKNINHLYNGPPRKGIEQRLQVRINNLLLAEPVIENGWLVYRGLDPAVFAPGANLVSLQIERRPPAVHEAMTVEKLELNVDYR